MGLDMYLRVRDKIHPNFDEELMYWRKANQIRRWFVENLENFNPEDNGGMYIISKEKLENLASDISAVLKNPKRAKKLMPVSSGFFFGSQEYDEHYFDQLKRTLENLQTILKETNFENEEVYYTEWW